MDMGIILYLIVLIVLIVLIFKFIKKIIWAIVTSVLLVVLTLACIGGLVYLDYKALSELDNAQITVAYLDDENYITGMSIPVSKNEEINPQDLVSVSESEYDAMLKVKKDNEFTISIDKQALSFVENETIDLTELLASQGGDDFASFLEGPIEIKVRDLLNMVESENPSQEVVNILVNELDVPEALASLVQPLIEEAVSSFEEEMGLELKTILFALAMQGISEDETNIVDIVVAYQDGDITVHPNKFSFRLVKYVPVSFVQDMVLGSSEEIEG